MFDSFFAASAAATGVPASVLVAVAWKESSMRPDVDPNPPNDGVGLMGITYRTAQALGYTGTREELKDAATNIEWGAKAAAEIIARQGGLNLANFYSEYNSGRAELWRTSQQVAANVAGFLRYFAREVGIELPATVSIDAALAALSTVSTAGFPAMLLFLGLVLYFWKVKKR